MGRIIRTFLFGAAGAFDLSGEHFRQRRNEMLAEIKVRTAELESFRKKIDANSTRRLSAEAAIASDWKNVGNDLRKAISVETLSLK